jgi:hypothetical protein
MDPVGNDLQSEVMAEAKKLSREAGTIIKLLKRPQGGWPWGF